MHGTSLKGDPLVHFYLKVLQTAYRANKNWDDFQVNPIPHRYAFLRFCKQSRPRSGSSCKSCLIRSTLFAIGNMNVSDPTQVDLTITLFIVST